MLHQWVPYSRNLLINVIPRPTSPTVFASQTIHHSRTIASAGTNPTTETIIQRGATNEQGDSTTAAQKVSFRYGLQQQSTLSSSGTFNTTADSHNSVYTIAWRTAACATVIETQS